MQQQSKTRVQRSGSNAGGLTPTLVPIPMSEDIERMGESPDNIKHNVSPDCLKLFIFCLFIIINLLCYLDYSRSADLQKKRCWKLLNPWIT